MIDLAELTPDCRRSSPSWGLDGAIMAATDELHREELDGISCVFIGRRTRNLLPPELTLPVVAVDPHEETVIPSTACLSVLYLFSVHVRGQGSVELSLRNIDRPAESASRTFISGDSWQRVCIALDGVFAPRRLQPSIRTNGNIQVERPMLEPYAATQRAVGRARRWPCAGAWVPGGRSRDRDRLEIPLRDDAIPASGMIDVWFLPTWHALHPQHAFFQVSPGYFGCEIGGQHPVFFAGEKPCQWHYYWEWATANGFAAYTWHHLALVWRETGGVTLYLDGQSRAHAEQIPAHALDPHRLRGPLVLGGTADGRMGLDPNVPGELDAYLATWRLRQGNFGAADVLAAREDSDPRPADSSVPAKAIFLTPRPRHLIAQAPDHCWFALNLSGTSRHLRVDVHREDDHQPSPTERPSTSDQPRALESRDGGLTWQPAGEPAPREPGILADGCCLHFHWRIGGDPPATTIRLEEPDGSQEEIAATFDLSGLDHWQPGTTLCAHKVLALQGGSYLLFASGSYPGADGSSVFVFRSRDLREWSSLGCPYRPDGVFNQFNETSAVQLPSGRIVILMRTGGWNAMLARGISDDGGLTWSPPGACGLRGIQPRLRALKDGSILLVTGRPGIIAAISTDAGETFATIACAEDDRLHEASAQFGWYGYSCMNNGVALDEDAGKIFLSYDLLDQHDANGRAMNGCYLRRYDLVALPHYDRDVSKQLSPGDAALATEGRWSIIRGRAAITAESGATLVGEFTGTGLVARVDSSTHAGVLRVQIDDQQSRWPLYLPYCRTQRLLLAHDLPAGRHVFRLRLEAGTDHGHVFVNPEMPVAAGVQTIHLAGTSPERRLAVYGLEVLR